jgi:hypothetical protein
MADEENAPLPVIDYEEIDTQTGFRTAELAIWKAFETEVLKVKEDDRPDPEGWVDQWADEHPNYDRKRVKAVATYGIYTGGRDNFNERSGTGKAFYQTGDTYEGEFYRGKKHGTGHYVFVSQGMSEVDKLLAKAAKARKADEGDNEFVARLAATLRVGKAIVEGFLEFGALPCYHGNYDAGHRSGQGVMKCNDGSIYNGEWLLSKRHGQGLVYYVNGDVYSGLWDAGKKHGIGTYRFANGGEYRGEWNKGVFVEGQWIMRDGNYFEGKFDAKNRPCDDDGQMHFPDRHVAMKGVFRKSVWAPTNDIVVSDEAPVPAEWVA